MRELDYSIVDVFTESALAGNPLAVVMNQAGSDTARMQAIAREFNLSETTFVERRPASVEQREGVRVRIFTTQEELPFAGHPTLGTASVLKLVAPETLRDGVITLDENVGPIRVRFPGNDLYGEMTQRNPEFGQELDPVDVAGLCGLIPEDLDRITPPQIVSTGTAFAIVLVRRKEALAALKVRQEEATEWLRRRGARWFYFLLQQSDGEFRARMQFNGGEDPATGSAAGCAIAYLVHRGIVHSGQRLHVRQGVEIGRPSDLFLQATKDVAGVIDVRVGGSTVPVANGRIFLP